jgi:hypothetical protein
LAFSEKEFHMKLQITSKKSLTRALLLTLGSLLPLNAVFAANGILVYAPVAPANIPTLGGSMLILLSLLLFAASFKLSKKAPSRSTHLLITFFAVGTFISAGGGIKLISDAHALSTHSMVAAGGNLPIDSYVLNNYTNNTGVSQEILSIVLPEDIVSEATTANAAPTNDCADTTPPSSGFPRCQVNAVLADGQTCSIDCAGYTPPPEG